MESVIKLKLTLDEDSQRVLQGQSRICNWLYNRLLERANVLKEQYVKDQNEDIAKILYSKRGLRNLIPAMKSDHLFLKSVHSSPLKNVGLRLSESIQAYQKSRKGLRKGKQTGWPRFRSNKVKPFSLLYDEPGKGFKVSGKSLRISLGVNEDGKRTYVSAKLEKALHKFPDPEVRQLRIKEELGQFYGIFTIRTEDRPLRLEIPQKVIALDPNHKNMSWGVDLEGRSIEIQNPWFMKEIQKRIDRVKSKRDKAKKRSRKFTSEHGREYWLPSRRWKHLNQILERLYRKRREQTKTYIFTVAHYLYQRYDLVSIGDYTPRLENNDGSLNRNMRREMFNHSLIGRLKNALAWVAKKAGKEFMEWDEFRSSKTCSYCGEQLPFSLSPDIRTWECPACQRKLIRDENAARNGLIWTMKKKNLSLPGSGHLLEVSSRCSVRFDGLGLHSVKSGVY